MTDTGQVVRRHFATLAACGIGALLLAACVHPGVEAAAGADPAAVVLGKPVQTRDADELRYEVLKPLTDRYAAERGIDVTQAEIEAYVRRVREGLASERAQRQAERDEIARRLAAGGLSESERTAQAKRLESLDGTISALAEPAGDPQETRAARERIARAFILQWKINQALYRQYGGRIGFQQGGPEPLDACRRFLEESQARGDFRILDPALATAFWRYYVDDRIHSFYRSGSPEEAQAFRVPWWEAGDQPAAPR